MENIVKRVENKVIKKLIKKEKKRLEKKRLKEKKKEEFDLILHQDRQRLCLLEEKRYEKLLRRHDSIFWETNDE